jgi:outer membrane protein OmpA-like peptidoglycan-associated protein
MTFERRMGRRSAILLLVGGATGLAQEYTGFGDALTRGRDFYTAKQYDRALKAFEFAFSRAQSPKESAQATARIGQSLDQLGRTREAIEYMQRSLDFFRYEQVEAELKELRLKMLGRIQTSDEITAALRDQQASNRSTRVMPRHPLDLQVNFDFDKATLTRQGQEQVDQLGMAVRDVRTRGIVKDMGGEKIRIVGHTDLIGKPEYNQALSERRARAVALEISKKFGVPMSMMETIGKGMREPLYNSTGEEDSRLNRRVEVVLLKPGEGQ